MYMYMYVCIHIYIYIYRYVDMYMSPQGHWRFYLVVNFKARGIIRGVCKLTWTSTVIKKKKIVLVVILIFHESRCR